ncbi:iron-sulfur cluster insertion protein ErpA [Striga asiatica]|uniref:Iron-sulfur cluster insertion protein ErpA n=1 Tax=Striga asiatica TaxID=4170 RepID=A0A5A7QET3_STRAF|nr:iron-sulfur cluster insertion protein ErpA [Striga asiatica]
MTTAFPALIRRLAPYLSARVHRNSRFLSSTAAVPQPQLDSIESPSLPSDAVHMTEGCVRRMKELQADEGGKKLLRLSIEAGGCSGFQYNFLLDEKTNSDDREIRLFVRIFEQDGVKLVVDNISFDFVKGATVDYVEELIRSAFQVSTNPSAVGGCSCKSSFMVK